tara:strand:+ start:606 stop:899 length:294 start_codon:yes stop_codon:yes gene_type:complete
MTDYFRAVHLLVGGNLAGPSDGPVSDYIFHDGQTPPTEKAIQAKLKELQADYDAKKYQRDRAVAYDPIPEQLDQIYHDIDGWKAKIKAVKDKYPKPT